MEIHNISPVYNDKSRILILGSFPSVKSREVNFFYGHPQNRFWKVLSHLYGCKELNSVAEKKKFLLDNKIALWDVIKSCDIKGSDDNSIENVVPNDISVILNAAPIERVFCNGAASFKLYNKFIKEKIGIEAVKLPSTSPANAGYSLERLTERWKIISEQ